MAAHWPRWTERAVAVVADEGHWQLPAGRRQDWRRLLFRPTEVDFADARVGGDEWKRMVNGGYWFLDQGGATPIMRA
jgi:hypothetical protein